MNYKQKRTEEEKAQSGRIPSSSSSMHARGCANSGAGMAFGFQPRRRNGWRQPVAAPPSRPSRTAGGGSRLGPRPRRGERRRAPSSPDPAPCGMVRGAQLTARPPSPLPARRLLHYSKGNPPACHRGGCTGVEQERPRNQLIPIQSREGK